MNKKILIAIVASVGLMPILSMAQDTDPIPKERNGKVGFVDSRGKEIIPFKYDNTIVEKTGSRTITRTISLDEFRFTKGIALVLLKGKWGGIDKSGKVIIPIKYDYIGTFSENGEAYVKNGDHMNIIDRAGTESEINYPAGLPVTISCGGKSYAIVNYSTGKEDGKTFIKVISPGVHVVPTFSNMGMTLSQPVKCAFISEGQEYTSRTGILHDDISFTFSFETSIEPDKVVFYCSDKPENRIEIDCK